MFLSCKRVDKILHRFALQDDSQKLWFAYNAGPTTSNKKTQILGDVQNDSQRIRNACNAFPTASNDKIQILGHALDDKNKQIKKK